MRRSMSSHSIFTVDVPGSARGRTASSAAAAGPTAFIEGCHAFRLGVDLVIVRRLFDARER